MQCRKNNILHPNGVTRLSPNPYGKNAAARKFVPLRHSFVCGPMRADVSVPMEFR
jgi:hypothetical protein